MFTNIQKRFSHANLNEIDSYLKNPVKGNRVINKLHVKNIAEQMVEYLEFFPPITVNDVTNHIVDGQHRANAFKQLIENRRLPEDSTLFVMHVNCSEDEEKILIVNANTNSKNWTLSDFIHRYAKENDNYALLESWCADKSHPLLHENASGKKSKTYRYRFASAILKGKSCQKELKDGSFSVTDDEYAIGNNVYNELSELFKILVTKKHDGSISRGYGKPSALEFIAILWHERRQMHSFDKWLLMFRKRKAKILGMPRDNKKDWENILNMVHTEIDKNNQV